jgi:hypothetical protein
MRFIVVDGDLILTASTSELQSFVLRYINTRGVFIDPIGYAKTK